MLKFKTLEKRLMGMRERELNLRYFELLYDTIHSNHDKLNKLFISAIMAIGSIIIFIINYYMNMSNSITNITIIKYTPTLLLILGICIELVGVYIALCAQKINSTYSDIIAANSKLNLQIDSLEQIVDDVNKFYLVIVITLAIFALSSQVFSFFM
jgi:hypothetical protein